MQAMVAQDGGGFHADKTAADNDRAFGFASDLPDLASLLEIPQVVDAV